MKADNMDPAEYLVAHRGYAGSYPENTLPALEAAVTAGVRYLEFDLQLTQDRVPLLLHDDNFHRTGGHSGRVNELSFAATRRIGVGEAARFGSRYATVTAPALEEVVPFLQSCPQVTAFVEIKRHSLECFGVEAVLDAVLPLLQPLSGRCVIISFVAEVLQQARRRSGWPIGWALPQWNKASLDSARQLRPEYLFCNVRRLPAEPQALPANDWIWVIYEIVEPALARQLLQRGAGMIETMEVTAMLANLRPGTQS